MDWDRVLRACRTDWRLLGPLLAANLAGMVFGWYYYYDVGQFDPAKPWFYQPPYWWPLVSDSPNALLLFVVAVLAARLWGWRSRVLDATAFVLNIYVGLWTTATFMSYPDQMGTYDLASPNSILFVTHMGMPLQALTLLPDLRSDRWSGWAVGLFVAAMAAFVAVDYWGPHLHPAPFLHGGAHDLVVGMPGDSWLGVVSPILMAVAVGLWLALARPVKARAPRETA